MDYEWKETDKNPDLEPKKEPEEDGEDNVHKFRWSGRKRRGTWVVDLSKPEVKTMTMGKNSR